MTNATDPNYRAAYDATCEKAVEAAFSSRVAYPGDAYRAAYSVAGNVAKTFNGLDVPARAAAYAGAYAAAWAAFSEWTADARARGTL